MKKVLITGTVAFDEIETPAGSSGKVIGGAGTYISIASSLFTQNLAIVSIVGEDFPNKEIKYLNDRGINTEMIETVIGGKTFYWKGRYHENMISRDTLDTKLNVLEKFNPILNLDYSSSEIVLLGNLHPAVRASRLDRPDGHQSLHSAESVLVDGVLQFVRRLVGIGRNRWHGSSPWPAEYCSSFPTRARFRFPQPCRTPDKKATGESRGTRLANHSRKYPEFHFRGAHPSR